MPSRGPLPNVPHTVVSCLSRRFGWHSLVLVLAFSVSTLAPVRSADAHPPLTIEQRHRLEEALRGSTLMRWQRTAARSLLGIGALEPITTPTPLQGPASADGNWSALTVLGHSFHTAIYDPVRDRMVVFGGDGPSLDEVWALSLSGDSRWTKLMPGGTGPAARLAHTAIYDPARDRMVIFGGYGGSSVFDDVWALSFSGTPSWTQLTPSGLSPGARVGHTAIYDSAHDRMIVFGGEDWSIFGYLNDVWALSLSGTPAWTQLLPTGAAPTGRGFHTAIYDWARDRMLIFGGDDGSYPNRTDTWALSLSGAPAWTELFPMGTIPPPRFRHTAVYDFGQDRMVIFGGSPGGSGFLGDAWTLSLAGTPSWTQLTPAGTLPTRCASHTAIYDPLRGRMVVFGGEYSVHFGGQGDVWSLSLIGGPEWSPGPGTRPMRRQSHSAICDLANDRMVVFGGNDSGILFHDVWALSLRDKVWTELISTGTSPSSRTGHTSIYDPERIRMVVFGGSNGFSVRNDLWSLALLGTTTWESLAPTGAPPPARQGQSAIYDPVRDRMIIFGGFGDGPGAPSYNDVWALSLAGTLEWTQLTQLGILPDERSGHTAIYDPLQDQMIIFGGAGTFPYRNDVWALPLSILHPHWVHLNPHGTPPSGRTRSSAIYDPQRDRMVVFGGVNGDGPTWALSLGDTTWTQLNPTGLSPWGGEGHSAIYDRIRDRMVVFAGGEFYGPYNDTWALTWGQLTGVQTPLTHQVDSLGPCYPNPFNPRVTIPFKIRRDGFVALSIYDVSGRLVKNVLNGWERRGTNAANWDGTSDSGAPVSSGVYFCRITAAGFSATQKIVLLK